MAKKYNREEITEKLTEILVNDFEIDENAISPEANLFQDLELDSIDAVDLAVKLHCFTDKKISPESFKKIKTVSDLVETLETLL